MNEEEAHKVLDNETKHKSILSFEAKLVVSEARGYLAGLFDGKKIAEKMTKPIRNIVEFYKHDKQLCPRCMVCDAENILAEWEKEK